MFDIPTLPAPESDDDTSSEDTQADHGREQTHQGSTLEVIIDPALLADQQGAQSLAAALSTLSASILVSAEIMLSTYHLPEIIYGPRPTIPAIDRAILLKPKGTSKATMSTQIDELKCMLEASLAQNDQSCNTHDAQAAQLGLAGMLVNKSQIQLVNAKEHKKKKKGFRVDLNGFARIVTHSSLLEVGERLAQDNTTKASMAEYSKHREDDWKAFNEDQTAAHEAWKAAKTWCRETGVALMIT